MKIKRAVMLAVLAVAVAALAVPLVGLRARAAGPIKRSPGAKAAALTASSVGTAAGPATPAMQDGMQPGNGQHFVQTGPVVDAGQLGPQIQEALGTRRMSSKERAKASQKMKQHLLRGANRAGRFSPQSGEPEILNATSALSAALLTTVGGRDNQFSEVILLADWDGREDDTADRAAKVDDFSFVEPDIDTALTRTAISEHTFANGFLENVFYYGDSLGNVWVGIDNTGDGFVDLVLQINLPTVLNAFGTLLSDDQVTISGLAVNPVADLTSFPNVNGAFAPFAGVTGEILYVTYHDTESGLRLTGTNQIVRSGLLAFPISDLASPAVAPPGVLSDVGFPITVGGAFGVAFSVFNNAAGVAVDDDGSAYFQNVDLVGFTGGNIVKVKSLDVATNQDRSLATDGILTITTLNPAGGVYGTTSGPVTQVNRFTNYSGTSTTFGNIMIIQTGMSNVLYAGVARSFVVSDDPFTQATEGFFVNPAGLGATPSMVISFADCSGATDVCSARVGVVPVKGQLEPPPTPVPGQLPAANDIADVIQAGVALQAGVNNFRVFVMGSGPAITGTSAIVTPDTLKVDMQIDVSSHNGLAVDENNTVFVVSGGAPGGPGRNPSPTLGEILVFEDQCIFDRRADFVDFRGNAVPIPPASGGNVGDGDSDRFDHLWWQSPLDTVTFTPAGIAGLARGFLRYTNRLAINPIGDGITLGTGTAAEDMVQGDDDTDGPIVFESFDPGHQVAGGDDQNTPFRGDDDNGAGTPPLVGALSGGFEFVFGGPVGTAGCVWNGFFLNSNGNITFGEGDGEGFVPSVLSFRSGPPRIAPAWADLNPEARVFNLGTFPVQALGFSQVNSFKIRWINVPEFSSASCVGAQAGQTNTFSITLFDDGTGTDENANQSFNPGNPIGNNAVPFDLQEGPTDLRFTREPNTGVLVGCPPRPEGSGHFVFDYSRMDLLGTATRPVLTGYSIGGLAETNPPGLCETNLSEAARQADTNPFGVIQGQIASIAPCLIGEGTEPTIFEFFEDGSDASIGSGGEITLATPDFDLRFEGNDPVLCSAQRQRDLNRQRVGFFGIGCAPPAAPICRSVVTGPFTTPPSPIAGAPASSGLVNALCSVQLDAVGCGFFPNETTLICSGFTSSTGIPLQRPGKTVSTAASLACDTNGDGIAEAVVALSSVTPLNQNLVRGTLATLPPQLPGTAFPLACCGGAGTLTVTTTFTAGDNNIFGPFTRSVACSIDLGLRAPVVISITPSDGNCAVPQNTLITGACFTGAQGSVTSVFGVEFNRATQTLNTANVVVASRIQILSPTLIDALFNFGTANIGRTFLIFAVGPGGTSRNLTQGQTPAGCVFGNEQGIQVTFSCPVIDPGDLCPAGQVRNSQGVCTPVDIAVVNGCNLQRSANGTFTLEVFGKNIKPNAMITMNGQTPKKIKPKDPDPEFPGAFTRVILKGRVCPRGVPGPIVITNPSPSPGVPAVPSQPFACREACPQQ